MYKIIIKQGKTIKDGVFFWDTRAELDKYIEHLKQRDARLNQSREYYVVCVK